MPKYAFEAVAEFDGGTTSLPGGVLVDVHALLGGGKYETSDEALAAALRGHPAVREVPASTTTKSGKTGDKE